MGVIKYVGYVELTERSVPDLGVSVFLTAVLLELCNLSRHSQFEISVQLGCPEGCGSWRSGNGGRGETSVSRK